MPSYYNVAYLSRFVVCSLLLGTMKYNYSIFYCFYLSVACKNNDDIFRTCPGPFYDLRYRCLSGLILNYVALCYWSVRTAKQHEDVHGTLSRAFLLVTMILGASEIDYERKSNCAASW